MRCCLMFLCSRHLAQVGIHLTKKDVSAKELSRPWVLPSCGLLRPNLQEDASVPNSRCQAWLAFDFLPQPHRNTKSHDIFEASGSMPCNVPWIPPHLQRQSAVLSES